MSKFYGIIPARSGSKSIRDKNIKKLGGIPLVNWSINTALQSQLDEVIFDSDSSDYLQVHHDSRLIKIHRPSELARDSSLTVDVIRHACVNVGMNRDDYIVLLQPTCPFRTPGMIDEAIQILKKNPSASVISVVDCDAMHPLRMKRVVNGSLVNYVDTGVEDMRPRQALPRVYIRSGSIYACSVAQFQDNGGFGSMNQIPVYEDANATINIDSVKDFMLAELMLAKGIGEIE